MPARTRYARNGDTSIAYQVTGDGPLDLLFIPGFVSHLELDWADSRDARFFERLGSFTRLIRMDKRGTGLSDPVSHVPTLEERMEDAHAVLDAVGSERAALLGVSEGGPMVTLFAATYPERTIALMLYGSFASGPALPDELKSLLLTATGDGWGQGALVDVLGPELGDDPSARRAVGLYERTAASPGMARALIEALDQTDVTGVLPGVRVPTLVVHRSGDKIPARPAEQMAAQIPGAKFVELPGENHWISLGDAEAVLGEIEEFLTGARTKPQAQRALATVLFTDIVGSTERASELGDTAWRQLLKEHDDLVPRLIISNGGTPIKSLGDGFLATFDGPARAIEAAQALNHSIRDIGLEIRAGVHTGECELIDGDVAGLAVHIGARVSALADPSEILVSSTVKDLVVGSALEFVDRGEHDLKGVPGRWRLFSVAGERAGERDLRSTGSGRGDGRSTRIGDRLSVAVARNAPGLARAAADMASRRALRRTDA